MIIRSNCSSSTVSLQQSPAVTPETGRLHERWEAFNARKKCSVVPNAAIARELAGWCWSLAILDEPGPGLANVVTIPHIQTNRNLPQ